MMRNSRNIWAIEARAAADSAAGTASTGGLRAASLMALRHVSVESVNHGCLSHAERQPIFHIALERDIELSNKLLLFFSYVFFAVKLDLEGELSHQGLMLAASAPQGDVAFGDNTLTEVELPEREQNLLDDASVYQTEFFFVRVFEA